MGIITLSVIMIPLYATVSEYPGSLQQSFLIEALSIIFTMYLAILLIGFTKLTGLHRERKALEKKKTSGRKD